MSHSTVDSPAFDRAAALERVDGDRDFLKELAGVFLSQAQSQLQRVVDAVSRRDAAALLLAAHTLKGSVGNFSAQPAFELARALEAKGQSAQLAGVDRDLEKLRQEMARLETALRELLAEP